MKEFIFIIFIYLVHYISSSPIVIPLESFQSKLEKNSEFQTFIDELLNTNIVSTIKIGSQSYPLKTFYNIDQYFHISSICHIEESSSFNYKENFNYDRHKSDSFSNTSPFNLNFGSSSHACTATESFELNYLEKNKIKLEKINFILNEDTNEDKPNCLQIGLLENQYKQSSFIGMNLITQLKKNNYIKEYCWSMKFNIATKYNNDYLLNDPDELLNLKGNIIIGEYPHDYDSENYFKSQYLKTYSSFSENIVKWEFKFKKIYYMKDNKEEIIDDQNVNLDPSNYVILAPKLYLDSIVEYYFQKYIDDEICFYSYLNEYISIYCNKSDKFSINELKKFPSIYFEHTELNYTFELSFKDLFIEKNNNYWFLIASDSLFYTSGWKFGNIFMRKYQLIFNIDTKEIGFYNPKLSKNPNYNTNNPNPNNGSSNTILSIIIIIALCIILIGIGIFIKMKFFKNISKKKRANELDDDYEYISDKNIKKNNSDNNNTDNQLFKNDFN